MGGTLVEKKKFAGKKSMLTAIGGGELIAQDEPHYVELAVKLGTDSTFYEKMSRVFGNAHGTKLFESDLYIRHLEAAFLAAWSNFLHDHHGDGDSDIGVENHPLVIKRIYKT